MSPLYITFRLSLNPLTFKSLVFNDTILQEVTFQVKTYSTNVFKWFVQL